MTYDRLTSATVERLGGVVRTVQPGVPPLSRPMWLRHSLLSYTNTDGSSGLPTPRVVIVNVCPSEDTVHIASNNAAPRRKVVR
jgi:hypothetical protein